VLAHFYTSVRYASITSTSKVGWFVQLIETKAINSLLLHGTGNNLSGGAVAGKPVLFSLLLASGCLPCIIGSKKMRKAIPVSSPEDSVQLSKERSIFFAHIIVSCWQTQ